MTAAFSKKTITLFLTTQKHFSSLPSQKIPTHVNLAVDDIGVD